MVIQDRIAPDPPEWATGSTYAEYVNGVVILRWQDNSRIEDAYVVEKSTEAQGESFEEIARVPANQHEFREETQMLGRYRVFAISGKNTSESIAVCLYLPDNDGDGFGGKSALQRYCPTATTFDAARTIDCNDSEKNSFPGNTEFCDGLDNDCDGQLDEGVKNVCGGCGTIPTEVCDGIDNDCDGPVDEDCDCVRDQTRPCYSGPEGTAWTASCRPGTQSCLNGTWSATCEGEVKPVAETCDGKDNDCNGTVDSFQCGVISSATAVPARGSVSCAPASDGKMYCLGANVSDRQLGNDIDHGPLPPLSPAPATTPLEMEPDIGMGCVALPPSRQR